MQIRSGAQTFPLYKSLTRARLLSENYYIGVKQFCPLNREACLRELQHYDMSGRDCTWSPAQIAWVRHQYQVKI